MKKKALVLGNSKGVGKAIAGELSDLGFFVPVISSKVLDTSNMESVEQFVSLNCTADVLIFNTGGPPKKNFYEITISEFDRYHQQLFLSMVKMLQKIKINEGGYIFIISSHLITEPNPDMVLSETYRAASWVMLKALSRIYAEKNISCVNISLGPILTERLKALNPNIDELEKSLPMGRAGSVNEVAKFVRLLIEGDVKYLTGINITFDGGISHSI